MQLGRYDPYRSLELIQLLRESLLQFGTANQYSIRLCRNEEYFNFSNINFNPAGETASRAYVYRKLSCEQEYNSPLEKKSNQLNEYFPEKSSTLVKVTLLIRQIREFSTKELCLPGHKIQQKPFRQIRRSNFSAKTIFQPGKKLAETFDEFSPASKIGTGLK